MKKSRAWGWVVVFVWVCVAITGAEVRLPAIFGEHMVLQQRSAITVWGWAQPGEKVSVKADWAWFGKSTRTDRDGNWSIRLRTPGAGGPHSLIISGQNTIALHDVLIGEVWICSGQSNMDFTMASLRSQAGSDDVAKANYPQIRLFTVKKEMAVQPQPDLQGTWQTCTPEIVKDFSAVAFYFGRTLNTDLNVPVALISAGWGGTLAEAWTSTTGLEPFDSFKDTLAALEHPEKTEYLLKELYAKKILAVEKQIESLDTSMQEGWNKPNLDDSDWKVMDLPAGWGGTELETIDGVVWFRRIINLPPSWASKDLELCLGPIDEIDTVWVNGIKIGTTFGWDMPRMYRIPAATVRTGENSIVVRVTDTGFNGGFVGKREDMRIGPVGADVATYATAAGTWRYKVSSTKTLPTGTWFWPGINSSTPTVLYNAMVHPLIPFRIAGVIWYQGEAHCHDPIPYRTLFPAMITDWRKQWGQGDFPFYYVQIAPYEYNAQTYSQAIREAQLMTLDTVPNVGMAVTMDIGEEKNVHPKNKRDVGDRLARWALAKTYGRKDVVYSGPLYKEMKVEQDAIRISFKYVEGGLTAKGGPLTDFMIAGPDHNFLPAKTVIQGDNIVVSSPNIKNPVAVRYAWNNWACPNLFNTAGLPASSFRTDDWPLLTYNGYPSN